MKRDLKINYSVLHNIVSQLRQYKEAIECIDALLSSINQKLENENEGEAIEALQSKYDVLKEQINSTKEEIEDLYNIFYNYINDMTSFITPINSQEIMRVSRNDIYWNKNSIKSACEDIGDISVLTYGKSVKLSRKCISLAKECSDNLQNDIDDMNRLYNNYVIPYENTDDQYRKKACDLNDKYSDLFDILTTMAKENISINIDIFEGIAMSFIGLVVQLYNSQQDMFLYPLAAISLAFEKNLESHLKY